MIEDYLRKVLFANVLFLARWLNICALGSCLYPIFFIYLCNPNNTPRPIGLEAHEKDYKSFVYFTRDISIFTGI